MALTLQEAKGTGIQILGPNYLSVYSRSTGERFDCPDLPNTFTPEYLAEAARANMFLVLHPNNFTIREMFKRNNQNSPFGLWAGMIDLDTELDMSGEVTTGDWSLMSTDILPDEAGQKDEFLIKELAKRSDKCIATVADIIHLNIVEFGVIRNSQERNFRKGCRDWLFSDKTIRANLRSADPTEPPRPIFLQRVGQMFGVIANGIEVTDSMPEEVKRLGPVISIRE